MHSSGASTTRALEQEIKLARKAAEENAGPEMEVPSARKFRFRAATLKAHRAKVGLSAKDYGSLIGASMLSIYKWEDGKVTPMPKMLPRISAVLRLGKREAHRRLASLQSG